MSQRITLSTAQFATARSYGFDSWSRLKLEVEVRNALDSGDLRGLVQLLTGDPGLARTVLDHFSDYPRGVTPLSYVAMLRFDTGRHLWCRFRPNLSLSMFLVGVVSLSRFLVVRRSNA